MNENKPSLLLVDGMALLFRAYFATAMSGQFMINSKGIPTNGVYGFVKHFLTAVSSFNPSHVAVCWDMGSKTFRTEMFDAYKANRPEAPIELVPQFDLVKEVVEAFDVPNIGLEGFEADDCIGTIAKKASQEAEVLILTGDQDMLQLLDDNISVILLQKGYGNYLVHTTETFYEEKGITPKQMIDLKAFMGDTSDNYPGVKGIGEKTALKLLQQFEHIEGVLENLEQLTKGQRAKIEQDLEMLHLSRQLAEIKCDVPVECPLDLAQFTMNREKVLEKFTEIEFRGLHRFLDIKKEYA
ncbi:5'-3' exonuclease [Cytobacillus firmus]|jgi:5'-3' exonuclease|uniref:5'-3' exonuclease n=1 Tax=Cytobacillus firmus TaxID=1399 RepID=A0AA46PBN8_CYTFI|nr:MULTISPECIES: 5'-3' exonuclease H3TH domain-containing protein [Bacillaceae]KML46665.1 5'-3' exonuclease [Cytobacillus firmus]MBG9445117.1 5'-3' exonuclease [Cytobacillus firmus]MBG9590611.1 5'-3' exonuclease [Cytobacillus firmus]MBY6051493.1 5'-3' exonuclease [Cytobacillus firmus]MCC3647956.1 5'-3' exonuclease [Cytobacillus oceanisediminis]